MEIFGKLCKMKQQNIIKKMLNLGCGTHYHKNWINLDIKPADKSIIKCDIESGMGNRLNEMPFFDFRY